MDIEKLALDYIASLGVTEHARADDYFDGAFCRVWKDGEWVDKDDYVEIETEED